MRKRIVAILLTVALLMGILPVGVIAADTVASGTCGDNLTWVLDSDGVLTISGTGDMSDYSDSNKSPWYSKRGEIQSVEISAGVTSIGKYAFYSCYKLTSVAISDSVTSIGAYAFSSCPKLTSISIPDGVTSIGSSAFTDCTKLTSISIPDSVTSIGTYAFSGCSSLTSISIPDSVTSIGDWAFNNCSGLTSISIPDSVTSIGPQAFRGCSSLTSISIPDSVTSIGPHAFRGCSSLTSISIPDSVTSIGYEAFYGCSSLTSISIPDSVTSIGDWAFNNCSGLTSISIPDSVTSIGGGAFSGCSSLTSISIPDSVTSIGGGAFSDCSSLTSISIPDSVTSIGGRAFYGCSSLTSVTIPDSVTSIGNYAFSWCSSQLVASVIKESAAEAYCIENGIKYKLIHDHIPVTDAAVAATCTTNGKTEGSHCSVCEEVLVAQTEIPAKGHSWDDGVVTTKATCKNEGVTTYTCTVCKATKTESIPLTDHDYVGKPPVAATCTTPGYTAEYVCRVCQNATGGDMIPALGHSFTHYVYNNDAKVGVDGTETATCDRDGCDATHTRTAVGTALPAPPVPFTDVKPGAYYESAVNWAVDNDITKGMTATTFGPETNCTRGQVVTFLWRAAGKPEPAATNNPFSDVAAKSYCYKAVLWAAENGITAGTTANTFSPDASCTREQVVTFLWRASGKPKPQSSVCPFTDVKQSGYAYDAILWAVEQGITKGASATKFDPKGTCTRGQVVTFLYRKYVG